MEMKEVARMGREDADAVVRGEYDRDLEARLLALELRATAVERLAAPQRRALLKFVATVASLGAETPLGRVTLARGLMYGFALGHDYALAHGRLLGEGEARPG